MTSRFGTLTASAIGIAAILLAAGAGAARAVEADEAGRTVFGQSMAAGRPACTACHLANGAGQPDVGIPRLAGLSPSYIEAQLGYFATGVRANAAMAPYAAALSPAQRTQVAAYLGGLSAPPADEPSPAGPVLAHGRDLFLNGSEHAGLIGCTQCHGPTGLGVGDFSPRLAGQSAAYVSEQLRSWRAGHGRDPQDAFMRSVAPHLSDADLASVAAYVASLQPTGGAGP